MFKYAFHDENGNVCYTAQSYVDEFTDGEMYGRFVCRAVQGYAENLIDTHYFQDGVLYEKPKRPSNDHLWNADKKRWEFSVSLKKEKLIKNVEVELNRRLYLPCNGFDADKVSRERISGMIARLQRGDGLPPGWQGWRDANNEMQWTNADAATVLSRLIELSRAIEDREQALLIKAWQHKKNINESNDLEYILSYPVEEGW